MGHTQMFAYTGPQHSICTSYVGHSRRTELFKFKDTLPTLMRSSVVYQYTCPDCLSGMSYIGCTNRMLRTRVCEHLGISHRTLRPIKSRPFSSIQEHIKPNKHRANFSDFKIIGTSQNKSDLPILESILIKQLLPSLNADNSSVPLYIF